MTDLSHFASAATMHGTALKGTTTTYREMDMAFWLAEAEQEMTA